jgi:hypothetical protein
MCAFVPQTHLWPADRAVLLVHGIGNASNSGDASFPRAELLAALGEGAEDVAVYTLNYDFINDWAARKLQLAVGIQALGAAIAARFATPDASALLAEYCGDILWPVLHQDTRFAIREAYMAQLDQIMSDCIESMLPKGLDPRDARVSIVAHSLGCFHTYEALHAAVNEPMHHLRPFSDGAQLESVILMASPVQMMRTIAGDIGALVPAADQLATLNPRGLFVPAEPTSRKPKPATRKFISVTGTQDPVGGHLFGSRNDWAFMQVVGQDTRIVQQSLVAGNPVQSLTLALKGGAAGGDLASAVIRDPHSWSDYMTGQAALLAQVLA